MTRKRKPRGNPEGYNTLAEAIAACKEMFDSDAVIEVHEDGCEGEPCKCDVVRTTLDVLAPKASA